MTRTAISPRFATSTFSNMGHIVAGVPTIQRFGEVTSTNEVLAGLADQGATNATVVVAEHQTAGRGRRGRRWEAPPASSLLVSVLFRPPRPLTTLAMALAAADACEEVAGLRPQLKWPNDLVVGDRSGKLG